ncbi:MAG: hypothetical protein ACR2OZ_16940 [Verrucomicrobiales bacterium]
MAPSCQLICTLGTKTHGLVFSPPPHSESRLLTLDAAKGTLPATSMRHPDGLARVIEELSMAAVAT